MESTKLVTSQIRLNQWAQIIRDRNESGLNIKDYCSQNNLSINAYYYWLRRVRETAIASSGIQFAELPAPAETAASSSSEAIIVEINNAKISVGNNSSREAFSMVVEVLSHA